MQSILEQHVCLRLKLPMKMAWIVLSPLLMTVLYEYFFIYIEESKSPEWKILAQLIKRCVLNTRGR